MKYQSSIWARGSINEEVNGETEASKRSKEIKVLCWEYLRSWTGPIWLRIRWERQRRFIFISYHVGRNIQKIHFLY